MGRRAKRAKRDDQGAAAVEFALVSVLLFTLLFGIIQYGFLFFQYQAAAATAHDAARLASLGLNPDDSEPDACTVFAAKVVQTGLDNGLPESSIVTVELTWKSDPVEHGTSGEVQVTFKPSAFGAAFVPMPSTIVVKAVSTAEELGTELDDCAVTPP